LYLRDTDQRRSSQAPLDLDDPSRFVTDALDVPARALSPGTENLAACPNAQYPRARARRFCPKLGQHRVEHRTGDLVAVFGIVQRKGQDVSLSLDHQPGDSGIRQMAGLLRRHAANGIQETLAMSTTAANKEVFRVVFLLVA
jgi:hypothetical protein